MTTRFRLVETDDIEPLPPQKKGRRPSTINMMDELDIVENDSNEESEDDVFTIESDLYDCANMKFKSIRDAVKYVAQKAIECRIFKNGKIYGSWTIMEGLTHL